jgi:tripartite-type tricarboxylate transporter receptor subunit TctC
MKQTRRGLLAIALIASIPVAAQTYPSKPIRLVVPGAAGASPDIMARLYSPKLAEALGQPVVVENVVGASGIIGTDKVAKAAADGYTLLYGFNQLATMNPSMHPRLPHQPQRDLAPIALVANLNYMWIASPTLPVSSFKEFIALARAAPGTISYASTGPGSTAHIGALLLERKAGIKLLHVPYRSASTAVSDLMAGIVDVRLDPVASSLALANAGKVKVLAVASGAPIAALPNVPPAAEEVSGYGFVGWHGFWAPAGTPRAILNRLNAAVTRVTRDPGVAGQVAALGYEPIVSTPAEMTDRIAREAREWAALIKAEGIQAEN